MENERIYLIVSFEHNAFWRPNECGYTRDPREAGRYTEEEAQKIVADANIGRSPAEPNEVAVLDPNLSTTIDSETAIRIHQARFANLEHRVAELEGKLDRLIQLAPDGMFKEL